VVLAYDETEKSVAPVPLPGPENPAGRLVSLSPDGRWLAGGVCPADSNQATLRLWNLTGATPKAVSLPEEGILGDREHATAPSFSPDGKLLAFQPQGDSGLRVWNVGGPEPQEVGRWPLDFGAWQVAGFSPDGRRLAVARRATAELQLFDVGKPDAAPLASPALPATDTYQVPWSFSQDGKTLAALAWDKDFTAHSVLFWGVSGPQPKALPPRKLDPVREQIGRANTSCRLVSGADGHFRLIALGGPGHLVVDASAPPAKEPISQTPLLRWPGRSDRDALAVAADGRTVASSWYDGSLFVYDSISHEIRLDTELPGCLGAKLHLTGDGRGLAVVHENSVVYLLRLPEPGKAVPRPLDADWLKRVQPLKGAEQLTAVTEELVRRNPWYEDKPAASYLDGTLVSLKLVTDEVTDLSPLRALTGLSRLTLRGSAPGKSRLRDLSPLKELPLEELHHDFRGADDRAVARSLKTLQRINGRPAADFWRDREEAVRAGER
jgi:WD40 repeat protein